jgi:hypothetical protein
MREDLRAQAQECRRLAIGNLDVTERDALIELASDLEHQAERLENQQWGVRKSLPDD